MAIEVDQRAAYEEHLRAEREKVRVAKAEAAAAKAAAAKAAEPEVDEKRAKRREKKRKANAKKLAKKHAANGSETPTSSTRKERGEVNGDGKQAKAPKEGKEVTVPTQEDRTANTGGNRARGGAVGPGLITNYIKNAGTVEALFDTYSRYEGQLNPIHLSACWNALGHLARAAGHS